MNLFTALKQSTFAAKLFSAIGFDFESAFKASNETALKAHFDAALSAAKNESAESAKQLQAGLDAAVAANLQLETRVTELTAAAALLPALSAAVTAAGINLADCRDDKGVFSAEKFTAAHKASVTVACRIELAKHGIRPLDETPVADAAAQKPAGVAAKSLTLAEFNAIATQADRMKFIRSGGKISE